MEECRQLAAATVQQTEDERDRERDKVRSNFAFFYERYPHEPEGIATRCQCVSFIMILASEWGLGPASPLDYCVSGSASEVFSGRFSRS